MKQNKSLIHFADHLQNQHYSPCTIRAYVGAVRQYLREYRAFTSGALDRYKLGLITRYSTQTVNQRITAVNRYISFMRGYADNPALRKSFGRLQKLPRVKLQKKSFLESSLSQKDFQYLKRRLRRDGRFRWYYMVRLLAATGVRVSELVQIRYEDLEAGYKDICGKAGKERRILIPDALRRDALQYYQGIGVRGGPVMLNARGGVVTPRGVNAILKACASRYGINAKVMHPHAFRHLYAQSFLKACPDLSLLADLLGHDNINTTRIYLQKTSAQMQALVNRVITW